MGCLYQGNGLHIIQLEEIQHKFPPINPIPQPSTLPCKPKSPLVHQLPKPSVPTPVKQTPTTLPPASVEKVQKTLLPPKCKDPKLQKHVNALYSDPVNISLKTTTSCRKRFLSWRTLHFQRLAQEILVKDLNCHNSNKLAASV
jgi:hypothetical protein